MRTRELELLSKDGGKDSTQDAGRRGLGEMEWEEHEKEDGGREGEMG